MNLRRRLNAAFDHVIKLFAYVAGVVLVLSMLAIFADVMGRKLLNASVPGTLEMTEYALCYITFLSLAWLLKEEGHVRMDILLNRLSSKNKALLNMVTSIVGAIVCLVVAWFGALVTWDYFQRGISAQTQLATPLAIGLAPIPIGTFLFSIQFARRAREYMKSWKASTGEGVKQPEHADYV